MGEKSPLLPIKVKDWISRCKEVTQPHYSDVHKVHLKVKTKLQSQL